MLTRAVLRENTYIGHTPVSIKKTQFRQGYVAALVDMYGLLSIMAHFELFSLSKR